MNTQKTVNALKRLQWKYILGKVFLLDLILGRHTPWRFIDLISMWVDTINVYRVSDIKTVTEIIVRDIDWEFQDLNLAIESGDRINEVSALIRLKRDVLRIVL